MTELTIDCTGLTFTEGKELQELLRATEGVEDVQLRHTTLDSLGEVQAHLPYLHLVVDFAQHAAQHVTDHTIDLVETALFLKLTQWIHNKTTGKSNTPIELNAKGRDGKSKKKFKGNR